jgi:hypothetical protein
MLQILSLLFTSDIAGRGAAVKSSLLSFLGAELSLVTKLGSIIGFKLLGLLISSVIALMTILLLILVPTISFIVQGHLQNVTVFFIACVTILLGSLGGVAYFVFALKKLINVYSLHWK